jgi:lipopolysaccharide export system permease protein
LKLNHYIYTQLSIAFFPIFFGLFFITSIIYLVRIAALTSVITMNVIELLTLYMYSVPNIIFYTLPISFFIGLVISLAKLSSEYELTVITSFGLNPLKILKIFFPFTLLLGLALLIVSLGLIPKASYLTNEMLSFKKKEANFNIKSSEYGQKFGDWMIYIDSKEDNTYNEIKLFKTSEQSDQFIISKTASLQNKQGDLSFILNSGKLFYLKQNEINEVDFEQMIISDTLSDNTLEHFTTAYAYWQEFIQSQRGAKVFTFNILISMFPLISLLLVLSFGYFNPRYEKNRSVALSVASIVAFYLFADYLARTVFLHALYIVPIIWVLASYWLYQKRILRVY